MLHFLNTSCSIPPLVGQYRKRKVRYQASTFLITNSVNVLGDCGSSSTEKNRLFSEYIFIITIFILIYLSCEHAQYTNYALKPKFMAPLIYSKKVHIVLS